MNYKKKYIEHFNLDKQDDIACEYSWIVKRVFIPAQNIHHILHGCNKVDDIENLMAVSYEVHNMAHEEKLDRYYLKSIHEEFMNNNPYS